MRGWNREHAHHRLAVRRANRQALAFEILVEIRERFRGADALDAEIAIIRDAGYDESRFIQVCNEQTVWFAGTHRYGDVRHRIRFGIEAALLQLIDDVCGERLFVTQT